MKVRRGTILALVCCEYAKDDQALRCSIIVLVASSPHTNNLSVALAVDDWFVRSRFTALAAPSFFLSCTLLSSIGVNHPLFFIFLWSPKNYEAYRHEPSSCTDTPRTTRLSNTKCRILHTFIASHHTTTNAKNLNH